MKSVTNSKLIKRNAKIGQYTTIGALVVLGIGIYIVFRMPDKYTYSLTCLLAGFLLSQIGMYYGNRWGRSPRPDEIIDKNLKGMGREYTIYHYSSPASHLLVGPAGLWVLLPMSNGGRIAYNGKRWRSSGGGFARAYMRIFGQESMGRPEMEASAEIQAVDRLIKRNIPEGADQVIVRAALLFTDPGVELEVVGAPLPAMKPDKLKDFLKNIAKEKPITDSTLNAIRDIFPKPDREA